MKNRFMISVAVMTMLAGTGVAFGQGTGMKESPSGGGTSTQQSPGAAPRTGSPDTQMNRNSPDSAGSTRQDTTQSGDRENGQRHRAQERRPDGAKGQQSTQDHMKRDRTNRSESREPGENKGMKAERNKGMNAERHGTETEGGAKRSERSRTTGQAGAGARLSTEQRTKITSVIREQRVQPETHVNFNISVGTRVPRTVHFHPLPAEIITVYPDWRGYDFFLVRDRIVVVNPRTFEIVAVLDV